MHAAIFWQNNCILQIVWVSTTMVPTHIYVKYFFQKFQLFFLDCIGFALFAEQQSCHTLFQLSTSYTSQHFMQVCKNQEFYQLTPEQLSILLKSDDLNVPTEQDVFHALISWVQYDFETREKNIPELLGLIRLPLLPPAVSDALI